MTQATGIGSWPGTSAREAIRAVRDLLTGVEGIGLPYLPETPARGPGADLIGRAAALLVDLAVDLQPSGWRLVERAGRDLVRAQAMHRQDLDELAEAYDGYAGPLKLQITGPWTLAAVLERTRGERVLTDPGATRDLQDSLLEGIGGYAADVQRLVPGAELTIQLDEPSLPAVLGGRLPTASGYGRVRAVDRQLVTDRLRAAVDFLGPRPVIIHCCDRRAPLPVLRETGAVAISVDLIGAGPQRWESVAATIEEGIGIIAGLLPTSGRAAYADVVELVRTTWDQTGLDPALLARLTLSPTCGLAGASWEDAVAAHRTAVDAAKALTEVAG